jgi:hypothetical protein
LTIFGAKIVIVGKVGIDVHGIKVVLLVSVDLTTRV